VLIDLAYDLATHLASGLVSIAPESDVKAMRAFRERRGLSERFARWGREVRDPARPLIWFHAPSYGEGLQARPVIERIRATRPDIQLAYTFFSPSAESFARGLPVDVADYLPFDTRGNAQLMVRALRPSALVFSKLDVWPRLSEVCSAEHVPTGIISATMSAAAGRRKPLARALLRRAYASLSRVGAISSEDAARLVESGVRADAVEVTGDTRYDQVWSRATRPLANAALVESLRADRPTLVAGSTWPADEDTLLPAWLDVREHQPKVRLVIAPHEPTAPHLGTIEQWAASNQLTLARVDAPQAGRADVILVDRVGILGDLYSLGQAAFVGGGFGTAGLHSVLEPAAFGVPPIFGPRHANSRDADLLLEADGAASVRNVSDATDVIGRWMESESLATAAGEQARAVVQRGLGAADRAFDLVMRLFKH
jgi:3-deoxy-D-manno-octulosonic-acid transferase